MSNSWASESCCACLVTSNVSTMYSLSDPDTMQLYRECTNLWFQDDDGHLPQHLCIMCYKQCEIWKCFKTRCQENHRLMGYPSVEEGEEEDIQQVQLEVKSELDEDVEYIDHMNMADEDDQATPSRSSYDPLGAGRATHQPGPARKKKKRKDLLVNRESQDADYSIHPPSKKAKPLRALDADTSGSYKVSSASHSLYMKTYRDFASWMEAEGSAYITEDLLLKYFEQLSKSLAPSTLTNKLSHLVKTIEDNHNVKIDGFQRLRQFCRDARARTNSSYYTLTD